MCSKSLIQAETCAENEKSNYIHHILTKFVTSPTLLFTVGNTYWIY